ncbi:hypothetical protein [Fundicoccus culcitae]|uniref:Uncharacterized protein n=1 Tax=Fundicoccus culcitae TaxID=2969821 RepID=A0ABY5P6I7_9LACT|nr:hypothetical protein [Fundicoccus culcitae]UUX34018.1 hypothetical protein NRE15_14220 [Fundicoccus culcitae]
MKWRTPRKRASNSNDLTDQYDSDDLVSENDYDESKPFDDDYFNQEQEYLQYDSDQDMTQVYGQPLFDRQQFDEKAGHYPSRRDYHGHYEEEIESEDEFAYNDEDYVETDVYDEAYDSETAFYAQASTDDFMEDADNTYGDSDETIDVNARRSKYSAKIDSFLNNGIIITGILLIMVLLIAFLV